MNIQIFGKSKCFDTKKAERWFKERRIKYQSIDLIKYGMSGKEFDSVLRAVGGIDHLIDSKIKDLKYLGGGDLREEDIKERMRHMPTPLPDVGFKEPYSIEDEDLPFS